MAGVSGYSKSKSYLNGTKHHCGEMKAKRFIVMTIKHFGQVANVNRKPGCQNEVESNAISIVFLEYIDAHQFEMES